jgi:hypothetical protein
VIKNKTKKLALRRETLTALEMQAANGGAFVAATAQSICALCIQYPVIPRTEWPQTSIQTGVQTGVQTGY